MDRRCHTPHRMLSVMLALLAFASGTAAQNGFWSIKYANTYQYSATPYSVTINNADTWSVGTVNNYLLASTGCSAYYLTITKGATFFQAQISNPNTCSYPLCPGAPSGCSAGGPAGWLNNMLVYPFSLEWYDTSTSAVSVLPTRQNVPTNMVPESLTMTITQALATNVATSQMKLFLTILPRQTNLFTLSIRGWYAGLPNIYSAPAVTWAERDYSGRFPEIGASGRLGMQYFFQANYNSGNGNVWSRNWFRRKQPTPSFYFKYSWGKGCWWGNWWSGPPDLCGWYNRKAYFPSGLKDWYNYEDNCPGGQCTDWYTDSTSTSTSDWASTLAWEFYEDFRLHKNTVTLNFASVFANVSNPANGYAVTVQTTGNISFPLRLSWTNLTTQTDCCTASAIVQQQRSYIGVFMVPPFAIQDAWIQVYDENGNRLYTEVEKRVPYRGSVSGPGQPGWPLALSKWYYGSTTMYVTLRFNRRNLIGSRTEETVVNQLIGFVQDNGGDVRSLIAPIPLTLVSGMGILGAVANQAFATAQWMANITYQSCLTGNMTSLMYNNKLKYKLNRSSTFNTYFVNSTLPYHQEQIIMTIMLTAGLASEIDESTTYWTITDAFYPLAPTMLPQFWDSSMVSRLLGFSEIPTFCGYEMGNWTREYTMISAQWPWFGLEVTASQYAAVRAHVRRGLLASPAGEAFLPPFIHVLRHTSIGNPNTKISIEWSTKMVSLSALSPIALQGEIYPDFGPATYYKHQYFMRYGAVSPLSNDATTVPNYDGYLDYTRLSRQTMVIRWTLVFQETYKASTARSISAMSQKLSNLPTVVNGLGATSDQVQMATQLLASERNVLVWQIADANAEYATLP